MANFAMTIAELEAAREEAARLRALLAESADRIQPDADTDDITNIDWRRREVLMRYGTPEERDPPPVQCPTCGHSFEAPGRKA